MSATQDLPGKVVTRFAPSPTGFLHIGGARTALFNWLFARHHGGEFHLRIEDTDRARSTEPAIAAILDGMTWLNLNWDGEVVYQFSRAARHAEVAHALLAAGHAYRCYATPEELTALREEQRAARQPMRYDGRWRDRTDWPNDADYVIRLKAPREGSVTIDDQVQGPVTVNNAELDDFVLLRSDGTPTYMLAVVVDDHDMGVTHVIRGDDHLNNAFRQLPIIRAMNEIEGNWPDPVYAHIPLIHGSDGKKLSKRHGALGAQEYQGMGYPAAGMRNYLARLGWSHGDDEFFSDAQAKEWFDIDGIRKSPAQFDLKKLENICGQHIAIADDAALRHEIQGYLGAAGLPLLTEAQAEGLERAMYCLKERAKTLPELLEKGHFILVDRPVEPDEKALKNLDTVSRGILGELTPHLQDVSWDRETLEEALNGFAAAKETKFGALAGPLRAALSGRAATPSVYDMMLVLGRDETLARLKDAAA